MPRVFLSLIVAAGLALTLTAGPLPNPDKLPMNKDLPDPLLMRDGTPVRTADEWHKQRAPELRKLIQHYMYGTLPATPEAGQVKAEVLYENKKALGGKATLREVALTVAGGTAPKIHVLVVIPNQRQGPAPVFAGIAFSPNFTLVDDPGVSRPDKANEKDRGKFKNTWAIDQTIERGYAIATIWYGEAYPDRKDDRGTLAPVIDKDGNAGAIAIWAWSVQRLVDYLLTLPEIDATRVIAVGHSRLGKTVLLAAAYDPRIALAIPHQAGCGGTGPSRLPPGSKGIETVERINTSFPHWFNAEFKKFNKEPERLPFDQHSLTALVAPRPVLFSNAVEDKWANPDGQFEVLRAAEPVYQLLKAGGLASRDKPEVGKLSDGVLGYFIREGKHSMTREDWKVFLDFADKRLGKPKQKGPEGVRATRKVLFVGQGPDGHPPQTHEYVAGLAALAEGLKDVRGLEVLQVRAEGAWTEGPELLERVDGAVLFLAEGAKWLSQDEKRLQAFRALAKRGGGLAVLHWAMGAREARPIEAFVDLFGGCHGGPDRKYKVLEEATVKVVPGHSITHGLKDFTVKDEFYYHLKMAKTNITSLLRVPIDGEDHVVSWAYTRPGGGRAFGFSGLHFHANWKREEYRRLATQGVLWSLGMTMPPPTLIGHRGLLQHGPENTRAAFGACLDLRMGFELDIRRAKCGTLVCVHDVDVSRTTNGTGKVADLFWQEIQTLDAGSWFDPTFAKERVPALVDVFTMMQTRGGSEPVLLDIKVEDEGIEAAVVELAKKTGVLPRVVCIGTAISSPAVRERLKKADAKTSVAVLAQTSRDLDAALADKNADWVYIRFVPTAEEVERAHKAGKKVLLVGTTVMGREPVNWRRARTAGVDALLTDYPLECRASWRD